MKTALISVSDKQGVAELASALQQRDIQIIASAGTAHYLLENNIHVQSIEDYLQLSPMLDGRVKTLHPKLFAGILADRDNAEHLQQIQNELIDYVIVDLYPFKMHQDIEHIDIGGVALLRAAAKNHVHCTVIYDKQDYKKLILGELDSAFKKQLAAKAFRYCSEYDSAIANWMEQSTQTLQLEKTISLAYGENPHQQADFYNHVGEQPNIQILQGKPITYNNLLDLNAGINLIAEFNNPACTVIKHTNPCGVAETESIHQAVESAWNADAKSAFGGIVILNRAVDENTALFLRAKFTEVIAAPEFSESARKIFSDKPNCRLIVWQPQIQQTELRRALNGFLQQTVDKKSLEINESMWVTKIKSPSPDIHFAFKVIRHMKSNAIVIVKKGVTLAMGLGQTNRVDAVEQALQRAKHLNLEHAILASDGFFPFADSIDLISKTAIKTIIQPGGSKSDADVIEACNNQRLAMLCHGLRGFKH